MIVSVALLLAAVILLLCQLFRDRRRRMRIDLPGPRGLPLVGNVFQIDRQRSYETLSRWSRVYGDAYRISIFGQPVVVLSSVDTIREALVQRGRDFAGRPRLFFRAGFMADSYQDIVSASPGPVWNALRKTVQREIKWTARGDGGGSGRQHLDSLTADILDEMVDVLLTGRGRPTDPRSHVYDAVMNMTCVMLIGHRFRSNDEELVMYKRLERLVTTSMSVGGAGVELDILPWLRFLGNSTYRRLCEAKRLRDVLYDRIRARIDDDDDNGGGVRRGLAHALLAALHGDDDRKRNSALTSNNVKLAIVNLLIGGASSSSNYVYLLINVLAQNPDVQASLRAETDDVVGRGRRPSVGDRASMPYATATVLELLRYGSVSPIIIPHQTVRDTRIADVRIPSGVWAFFLVRRVHHDEAFWKDPYRFRPERFLDPASGQLLPAEDPRRRRLLSFSGGPRACPGERVATARLFLAAVILVQRCVVLPDSSAPQVSCDPRTFLPGLVLTPKDYRVCIVPRH